MFRRGRSFWERAVAAQVRSGLSQAAYAERQGVSVVTLRSWIYRLRDEDEGGSGERDEAPSFLPVRVIASTAPPARWQGSTAEPLVEVELPTGVRLRFQVGVDAAYVAALAKGLG